MNAQLPLLELYPYRLVATPPLAPFLKWPGGKSQELAAISAAAPELLGRFIDPFVGGGSVLLAVPEEVAAWANDAAEDLIQLYRAAAEERPMFRRAVVGIAHAWDDLSRLGPTYEALAVEFRRGSSGRDAVTTAFKTGVFSGPLDLAGPGLIETFTARITKDVPAKFERMRRIQKELGRLLTSADLLANIEGAVRAAFYMAIRERYNRARLANAWGDFRLADFFFLREFAYAAMFRFNSRGEFNVPYGGVTYNRKSLSDKIRLLFSAGMLARLRNTTWRCLDFEPFLLEANPEASDFVFVDPPYDSRFREYDNLSFGWRDQERLRQVLEDLPAKVMIVIKDTPLIRGLYRPDRWRVVSTRKTYMWTIKSRNHRDTTHLMITNY